MACAGIFNPLIADTEIFHRVAVDRLKWELGQPVSWMPPPPPTYYKPRYYYYYSYYYDYPYAYPWASAAASGQYHYSMGFRDGLQAVPAPKPTAAEPSAPEAAASACKTGAAATRRATSATSGFAKTGTKSCFPGDLMGFPSSSYRRPLCVYPVSTDTSYDNLSGGWPYGCKPFYFRHADPPSVRYC